MLIEVHKIISEPLGIEWLEEGGQIKVTGFLECYCLGVLLTDMAV